MSKFVFPFVVTVFALIFGPIGYADVLVYKESCGHYAFEDWHLTCKIDKNTFANAGPNGFWADPFIKLKSISICASFNNHGGLNIPPIIVYNYKDGEQSLPTNLFDTVKFQGNLVAGKLSWIGSSPRLAPLWKPSWTMRGELVRKDDAKSVTYTEILSAGRTRVGEVQATCNYLEGD